MKTRGNRNWFAILTLCALSLLLTTGCSENDPVAPTSGAESASAPVDIETEFAIAADKGLTITTQDGSDIPMEIAEVFHGDSSVAFWPYTGTGLSESPVDPINLVFKGAADPLQIRATLMSLDGNRAPAFPDMAPFNLTWIDAVGGDVQTTYVTETGWRGSVIQLTLGEYSGLRVHLRLFSTGLDDGNGGTWTLGGAHFEVMIPGTSEHQVLSWELAEQVVMYDLARCGLLAAMPAPTGLINAAPSFRNIPATIYNALGADPMGAMLFQILGYPAAPVSADVDLPSDGQGTLLVLGGSAPVEAGIYTNSVVIDYEQAVPRPICNSGPYDWLWVTGPLTFETRVEVTATGKFSYRSTYDGVLTAVPIDILTGQPIGVPFDAQITGKQFGKHDKRFHKVRSFDRRLALQQGAPELFFEILSVGDIGLVEYRAFERCFDED